MAEGYKFALLALPESRGGGVPKQLLALPDGFAVSDSLPSGALEHWRPDIGRIHSEELEGCSLFLWALSHSTNPGVLDQENEDLKREVYRLYLGLLIALPYFSHGRVTSLTGANANSDLQARALGTHGRTYHVLGAPEPRLSLNKFQLAAQLAVRIREHDATPAAKRITRALRAFREASEAGDLDQRLHQFVRCAEGFAVPPFKQSAVRFADRLGTVCAGRSRPYLKQLYSIRSGIEHLHGPFDRMPRRLSVAQRELRLLQCCLQAETVARYLLHTYLVNPGLWPHFESRTSIDAFWALDTRTRRKLWPTRLAFDKIRSNLDRSAIGASIS